MDVIDLTTPPGSPEPPQSKSSPTEPELTTPQADVACADDEGVGSGTAESAPKRQRTGETPASTSNSAPQWAGEASVSTSDPVPPRTDGAADSAPSGFLSIGPESLLSIGDDAFDIVLDGVPRAQGLCALARTCKEFHAIAQPRLRELKVAAEDALLGRLGSQSGADGRDALRTLRVADWRGADLTIADARILRGWMSTTGVLSELRSVDLRSSHDGTRAFHERTARFLAPAFAALPHLELLTLPGHTFHVERDFRNRDTAPSTLAIPADIVAAWHFAALSRLSPRLSTVQANRLTRLNVKELSGRKGTPRIDLALCNHGFESGVVIAALAARNSSLTYLDLSHNFVKAGKGHEAVAIALADCIALNTTLRTLKLRSIGLGPHIAHIAKALPRNRTLEHLDLRENGIDSRGARQLAASLKLNGTLTKLRLNKNDFPDSGRAAAALQEAAAANDGLKLSL